MKYLFISSFVVFVIFAFRQLWKGSRRWEQMYYEAKLKHVQDQQTMLTQSKLIDSFRNMSSWKDMQLEVNKLMHTAQLTKVNLDAMETTAALAGSAKTALEVAAEKLSDQTMQLELLDKSAHDLFQRERRVRSGIDTILASMVSDKILRTELKVKIEALFEED